MDAALLVGRIVLAAVFAVAGAAKLADRSGSREGLVGFGVPDRLAGPVGLVLPVVELGVAVCLLVSALAWWGALAALALLVLFCAAIAVMLARGTQPDCHCFGQLQSAPVGLGTLARNVLLAGLAGLVVVAGSRHTGLSATHWVTTVTVTGATVIGSAVLAIGSLAFLAYFCLEVLRQNGRILHRLDAIEARLDGHAPLFVPELTAGDARGEVARAGLGAGSRAPSFRLPDLGGRPVALEQLAAGGLPVLLVFSDPECGPCTALLGELARWEKELSGRLTLVLVSRGSVEQNRAKTAEHVLQRVLLQTDREVAEAYLCHGTPGAVLVRPGGVIGSAVAQGAEQIRALVAQAADPLPLVQVAAGPNGNGGRNGGRNGGVPIEQPPYPLLGKPAPRFTLPDLDGNPFALADRRGRETMLLFWNPSCEFCQRMVPGLKAWEANTPSGTPDLVLIAAGGLEENRALGLTTPVLLDPGGATMRAFAAGGTPMGVLIDGDGRVASSLAAGADAAFELARAASAERVSGAGAP